MGWEGFPFKRLKFSLSSLSLSSGQLHENRWGWGPGASYLKFPSGFEHADRVENH
jgi:hypothetical protein